MIRLGQAKPQQPEVIRASKFVLVDGNCRKRATLGVEIRATGCFQKRELCLYGRIDVIRPSDNVAVPHEPTLAARNDRAIVCDDRDHAGKSRMP
ncbi:MAG: hypothetical protein O3C40_22785 [Planctomycetota bacterium]|nr:hypothetical protein [Planctomycetota bacterium]